MKSSTFALARRIRGSLWIKLALIYLGWLTIVAGSYRHINIALLRGEAGWYQASTHYPLPAQRQMERSFFTQTHNGHYLPLGFWIEYRFTKWAGMHASIWKARQIATVALLATCIFLLVLSVAKVWDMPRPTSVALGGGTSALFVFQPQMTDMVAWPTMVLQFACLILTTLALWSLIQLVTSGKKRLWVWLAVFFSYTSMHAFGLGITTASTTAAVLLFVVLASISGKLPAFRADARNIGVALAVLVLLSVAHALCMLLLTPKFPTPEAIVPLGAWHVLGLIAIFPFILAANILAAIFVSSSMAPSLRSAWPFGLSIILVLASALFVLGQATLRSSRRIDLVRFVLFTFSVAAFLGCVLLIAVRQRYEPGDVALFSFVNGSRYVVPFTFAMFGIGLIVIMPWARRWPVLAILFSIFFGVSALIARRDYEINVYPTAIPHATIHHAKAWRLMLDVARESRTANLPIPNIPMDTLAWFSGWNLDYYEPLLHDELKMKPDERCEFVAWNECRGPLRAQYDQSVPSLGKLISNLELEPSMR